MQDAITPQRKRSGISSVRAHGIQEKLLITLNDIFSRAVCFKTTSEQISEEYRAGVLENKDYKRAPAHVKSYISGYYRAKRDDVYRYHIVWLLGLDGSLITSKEVDQITSLEKSLGHHASPNYKSPWQRINSDRSRHVWLDKPGGIPLRDKSYDERFRKPM